MWMKVVNFSCHCRLWLHFKLCVKWVLKISNSSFLPSKINVFVDTGFSIVAVCGHCWVEIPVIASLGLLMELFESEL